MVTSLENRVAFSSVDRAVWDKKKAIGTYLEVCFLIA